MTLRLRLIITLGLALLALWGGLAVRLHVDLNHQMQTTLDDRLAQSARMVAGMLERMPAEAFEDLGPGALSIPETEGLACRISVPDGEVLVQTHDDLATVLSSREPGYAYDFYDGKRWRVYTHRTSGLVITTADQMAVREGLVQGVTRTALGTMAFAIAGSLVALWIGVTMVMRPLETLRRDLKERSPNALEAVSTAGVPAELKPVLGALNHLLERMRDAIEREKRFTADAAHELRTPLTAIKTHLQLASRFEEPERKALAIERAEQGVSRLHQILEQLLMLARMENGQGDDALARYNVAEIRARIEDEFSAQTNFQWRSNDALDEQVPKVPGELCLLVVRNLLTNAFRYGEGAPVRCRVEWSESLSAAGALRFIVEDDGPGVPEDKLSQITDRFWRLNEQQGSGLGLSVVKSICDQFSGTLELRSAQGQGFTAIVTFPSGPR